MSDSAPPAIRRTLDSEGDIQQAIDELLLRTARQLDIFEPRIGAYWDRPDRIDRIRRFCLASERNRLRIALHDAESVVRSTPRLCGLLETFGHVLSIRTTRDEARRANDPLVIADRRHFLHRLDADASRTVFAIDDPEGANPLVQRYDQIWNASEDGPAGTTLGL